MSDYAGREGRGQAALVRLLESQGVDVSRVEYGAIKVEPVGDAFAIHFRSVLFVTPSEFAASMREPTVSDGSTT